jgi:hypothetical protein
MKCIIERGATGDVSLHVQVHINKIENKLTNFHLILRHCCPTYIPGRVAEWSRPEIKISQVVHSIPTWEAGRGGGTGALYW